MTRRFPDSQIDVYLYNNSHLNGAVMKDIHGKTWRMENVPHIDIVCERIENGTGTIAVSILSNKEQEIFQSKKDIRITNNKYSIEFRLEKPLVEAKSVRVILTIMKSSMRK